MQCGISLSAQWRNADVRYIRAKMSSATSCSANSVPWGVLERLNHSAPGCRAYVSNTAIPRPTDTQSDGGGAPRRRGVTSALIYRWVTPRCRVQTVGNKDTVDFRIYALTIQNSHTRRSYLEVRISSIRHDYYYIRHHQVFRSIEL